MKKVKYIKKKDFSDEAKKLRNEGHKLIKEKFKFKEDAYKFLTEMTSTGHFSSMHTPELKRIVNILKRI